MTNYLNGKIYKIVCNETNLTYYGSTVQTLKKRLSQHKENKNIKKYTTNKMTNPEIYLIEAYPCVNRIVPTRTTKEYYQDNKEIRKQQSKDYKDKHKLLIAQQRGVKIDCQCGGKYTLLNKSTHSKTKKHLLFISQN